MGNFHQGHNDPRAELVSKLADLHGWLQWTEERKQQQAFIAQKYQNLVPIAKKWGSRTLLLGTLVLTIASFTVAKPAADLVLKNVLNFLIPLEWAKENLGLAIVIMFAAPVVLSAAVAALIMLLWNKVLLPWRNSRANRTNEVRESHNRAVWNEHQKINAQLRQADRDLPAKIGTWYPRAYLYEDAVAFCVSAVQNHRANDITAALNLYETERHQAAMLAEQERTQMLVMMGNMQNDANARAANAAIRQEGAMSRTAASVNASRVAESLKQPRTVYFKRR